MNMITRSLILYLLLLNPISGLKVCWGEDGHIAIESTTVSVVCCDTTELDRDIESNLTIHNRDDSEHSDCFHCFDITISFESSIDITSQSSSSSNSFSPSIAPQNSNSFHNLNLLASHSAIPKPTFVRSVLRSLETTQLLI
jgi:hypothetical protein